MTLLVTVCLVVGLVPAALAAESQPDTIVGPNGQTYEIPSLDQIPAAMANQEIDLAGSGTAADPYLIKSLTDFQILQDPNVGLGHYSFRLETDLDLSALTITEWNGAIPYFWGNFDGNGHTITGIGDNRFLIYAWFGGVIEDLVCNWNGKAVMLSFSPGRLSSNPVTYDDFTMSNITTISENGGVRVPVVLSSDDQSNYSPFIYCGAGDFLMQDCTNYIDLSGDIYGAVFYGYGSIDATGSYTFSGCVNHGDVNFRNTALFFGNPRGLDVANFAKGTGKLVIYTTENVSGTGYKSCFNYGKLSGSQTVNVFCTRPNGAAMPASCAEYEADIKVKVQSQHDCSAVAHCGKPYDSHFGQVVDTVPLAGLAIKMDAQNKLIIQEPTSLEGVDHYVITYVANLQRHDPAYSAGNYWNGTHRYTISQTIPTGTAGGSIVSGLGLYDINDAEWDDSWTMLDSVENEYAIAIDGTPCYWIDATENVGNNVTLHANTDTNVHTCPPLMVILTAYSSNNAVVGSVTYLPGQITTTGV